MSDLLRKAFRLGFEASGEGYNGEYPFEGYNVDEDEEWCEMRDEALAPLAASVAAPVQVSEAIAIIEARLPLYTELAAINALKECISSIRAISGDTSNG